MKLEFPGLLQLPGGMRLVIKLYKYFPNDRNFVEDVDLNDTSGIFIVNPILEYCFRVSAYNLAGESTKTNKECAISQITSSTTTTTRPTTTTTRPTTTTTQATTTTTKATTTTTGATTTTTLPNICGTWCMDTLVGMDEECRKHFGSGGSTSRMQVVV